MEPVDQLVVILPALSDLVDRIPPAALRRPTPCARFDVADVLDHIITLGGAFKFLFRGEQPQAPPVLPNDGRVPDAAFRTTMDELLVAVRSDGAMTRIVTSPVGEMSGETFARLVAFDGVVHGWDLARGTGLDFRLTDDVLAAVDAFARAALTDELRDGETFKEATDPPPTATPLERLAAFSGRTV